MCAVAADSTSLCSARLTRRLCKDVWEYGELRVHKLELLQLRLELLHVHQRRILRVARLPQIAPELGDTALEFREAFCGNFCGGRWLQELQRSVHTIEVAHVLGPV